MADFDEWLEKIVGDIEARVLRYDLLTKGAEGLAYEKCEAVGARKILDLIRKKTKEVKEARVASLAASVKNDLKQK